VNGAGYTCAVNLNQGSNVLTVFAADHADNAAVVTAIYPINLVPPPSSLTITPGQFAMVLAEGRKISLVDNLARVIPATTWSTDRPDLVSIGADGTITPVASGTLAANGVKRTATIGTGGDTVTITGSYQGLSASAQITLYDAPALPLGTVRWSVPPLPGNSLQRIQAGRPLSTEDADAYFIRGCRRLLHRARLIESGAALPPSLDLRRTPEVGLPHWVHHQPVGQLAERGPRCSHVPSAAGIPDAPQQERALCSPDGAE
jgi:hypothetical protein